MIDGLDIAPDAEVIARINGAFNMLTDKAMSANETRARVIIYDDILHIPKAMTQRISKRDLV